ncbi:MAG: hypothetical protein J6Y33_03200 [Prevotella sp.]|nr:hypothetical protein [Prevotella sp.]
MKKIIFLMGLLMTIAAAGLSSCKGCKGETPKTDDPAARVYHDYDGVVQDFTAGVSHIQALHRQTMFRLVDGGAYEWRNSRIVFNDSVTAEAIDDLHVTDVNDVFCYWDTARGPMVQFVNSNVRDGIQIPWPVSGVWIEDADMSEAPIKLDPEQALMRLKEVNCPIPPAKGMSLRLPVGPVACNPQYVVGDVFDVIFIDAVTGEVSNWNPAFNPKKGVKGGDFGKPLGEWP